jgi:hypothetical protein
MLYQQMVGANSLLTDMPSLLTAQSVSAECRCQQPLHRHAFIAHSTVCISRWQVPTASSQTCLHCSQHSLYQQMVGANSLLTDMPPLFKHSLYQQMVGANSLFTDMPPLFKHSLYQQMVDANSLFTDMPPLLTAQSVSADGRCQQPLHRHAFIAHSTVCISRW